MARKKTNEEFVKQVASLVSYEYEFLEDYINAKTKINCRHNECGYIWSIKPSDFLGKGVRCPKCYRFGHNRDTEQFKKEVYELEGGNYEVLGEYVNAKTKTKMWHSVCQTEYYVTPSKFLQGNRCPKCKRPNYNRDDKKFKQEVYSLVKDEYTFLEAYGGVNLKTLCRHNLCGYEYRVSPNNFLNNGTRCPECGKKKAGDKRRKTNEEFVENVYSLVSDEYEFIDDYLGADIKIACRHNICGHEYNVTPANFLSGKRCPECNRPNYNRDNEQFTREVWDITGGEYEFLDEYINSETKIKCIHNKCGHKYYVTPSSFLNNMTRCPKCAGNTKKTNEEFTKEVFNLFGDEYVFLEEYSNAKTKIRCRHNLCGHEWRVLPYSILQRRGCPMCNRPNYNKNTAQFKDEVISLVGDEYSVLGDYTKSAKHIKMKHNRCGHEYNVKPNNFLNGRRCPKCAESKGEQNIRKHLQSRGVSFFQEFKFDELVSNKDNPLRFDFAVFKNDKLKFLVEYDGEFHYQDIYEDGSYETQQTHDQRKNQYCKDNNIPLFRIPYWQFDEIEKILEKLLSRYGLIHNENK